ncbi:MAG: hypothetical protein ACK4Z8_05385 [Novosphingobium sp.]
MSDPAMGRFFALQAVRASGAVLVLLGVLVQAGKGPGPLAALPPLAGIVLALAGLWDFFFLPRIVARRWRTPE